MPRHHFVLTTVLCLSAVGCGTSRPLTGLVSRFGPKPEPDKLALKDDQVSNGFRAAQSKLKNAESTMLSWAVWKEDTGQFAEARRRYQEILTENPDCVEARLGIARVERETGRFEQCLKILREAESRHPEELSIPLEIGRSYAARESWESAVDSLRRAVDVSPDDETARYELGLALAQAARYEEAIGHLKYAVGESAALYNIGYVLHESGRSKDAVPWFEQALASHPDDRTQRMTENMLAKLSPGIEVNTEPTGNAPVITPRGSTAPTIMATDQQPAQSPEMPLRVATYTRNVNEGAATATPPMHTATIRVPMSAAPTPGVATYDSSAQPPKWQGRPAAAWQAADNVQATAAATPAASQDPPQWRRR